MGRCYGYKPLIGIFPFIDGFMYQCSGTLGCCVVGDICHPDGICQFTHPEGEGFYSGYYINACADPTFTSPDCSKACTSLMVPDVAYNYTSETWACCGTNIKGNVSCNDPTNQTFSAPAPEKLPILVSSTSSATPLSQTATLLSTTTSQTPTSTSLVATPSSTSQSQTPLSGGAIAGIVIGAVVAVLIAIALVGFWLRQRRQTRSQFNQRRTDASEPLEKDALGLDRHEVRGGSGMFPQELDGGKSSTWTSTTHSYQSVPQHLTI